MVNFGKFCHRYHANYPIVLQLKSKIIYTSLEAMTTKEHIQMLSTYITGNNMHMIGNGWKKLTLMDSRVIYYLLNQTKFSTSSLTVRACIRMKQ